MKLGFFGARCDNGGLGIQSWEAYRHLKPYKTLVVESGYGSYYDRYLSSNTQYTGTMDCMVSTNQANSFLKDLDTVLFFETPYNWEAIDIARQRGVKTVIQLNYEWLELPKRPDLLLAPSVWHFDDIPSPKKFLPVPVNRNVLRYRLRSKAHTFVHIVGHRDIYGRNGTDELLEAMQFVESNIKLIVYSQGGLPYHIQDERIEFRQMDFEYYWELYTEGDVFIMPRKYGGLCLPLNEALSVGMPIIMPDVNPQNTFLPRELLISAEFDKMLMVKRPIEMYKIQPKDIAEKIELIANKDITEYSLESDRLANQLAWETLLPQYQEVLK